MIESVVALLMFVNGEIKEHPHPKKTWQNVCVVKDKPRDNTVSVKIQCWKGGSPKQRYTWVKKSIKQLF